MANILTLTEALRAITRETDFDGAIADILPSIDRRIESGTGIRWQEFTPIDPLAKDAARQMLKMDLGYVPQDELEKARLRGVMTHLQIEALRIADGGKPYGNTDSSD